MYSIYKVNSATSFSLAVSVATYEGKKHNISQLLPKFHHQKQTVTGLTVFEITGGSSLQ